MERTKDRHGSRAFASVRAGAPRIFRDAHCIGRRVLLAQISTQTSTTSTRARNTGSQDPSVTELTAATALNNPWWKRTPAKPMRHSWPGPRFLDVRTGRARLDASVPYEDPSACAWALARFVHF